jgi:hypothetical protein
MHKPNQEAMNRRTFLKTVASASGLAAASIKPGATTSAAWSKDRCHSSWGWPRREAILNVS